MNKFFSPRHKHNFDQFRFPIRGKFSIGTDPEVVLHEGELGYFPEGVEYGPQLDGEESKEMLILQFGGPSRQGFISYAKLASIQADLEKEGQFEGGKFYPHVSDQVNGESGIDGTLLTNLAPPLIPMTIADPFIIWFYRIPGDVGEV
jgi:hypothetical protein